MTIVNTTPGMTQAYADTHYQAGKSFQTSSPTTGQNIQMTDDNTDGTLSITPAGTLATLTITFPSDANSRIGQVRRFTCSQQVTILTLSGGTITNTVTSLISNDSFAFEKIASNKWVRQQ